MKSKYNLTEGSKWKELASQGKLSQKGFNILTRGSSDGRKYVYSALINRKSNPDQMKSLTKYIMPKQSAAFGSANRSKEIAKQMLAKKNKIVNPAKNTNDIFTSLADSVSKKRVDPLKKSSERFKEFSKQMFAKKESVHQRNLMTFSKV